MFKKMLAVSVVVLMSGFPVMAEETVTPEETLTNSKGFCGINYNRQDTEQTGRQVIVNDHSAFNININVFKKGALFKHGETEFGSTATEK